MAADFQGTIGDTVSVYQGKMSVYGDGKEIRVLYNSDVKINSA